MKGESGIEGPGGQTCSGWQPLSWFGIVSRPWIEPLFSLFQVGRSMSMGKGIVHAGGCRSARFKPVQGPLLDTPASLA